MLAYMVVVIDRRICDGCYSDKFIAFNMFFIWYLLWEYIMILGIILVYMIMLELFVLHIIDGDIGVWYW